MSERQEKKKHHNQKLEFIAAFEKWLGSEPPMILFWRWIRWKESKPVMKRHGNSGKE